MTHGIDPSIYSLAKELLAEIDGSTAQDCRNSADVMQAAFEDAANEIEEREAGE
jgi:hypothetical protein